MPAPLKMVYEQDAPLDALLGKTVAVIGFGSQGHAHAQNMRDSGLKVIVATRRDSPRGGTSSNWNLAKERGFDPVDRVEEAVQRADLVIVTLPDEVQPEVYNKSIGPHLKAGKAFGATRITSTSFGGTTVLKCTLNPCVTPSVLPALRCGAIDF